MAEPGFSFDGRVQPICEVGLSGVRLAEPDVWFDVSCHVHEAEVFRGRERFNERFEPGTASVTLSNPTGWFDLGGTYLEVAAAYVRPGRIIRIGVKGPWTPGLAPFVRWLYRGWIDQATPTYDPVLHDVVTVNCIDSLGEAGQTTAPTAELQGVNERVDQRINRVLDAVGWFGTKRKIDTTPTTVQGTELGASAIDHLGQAADSAGGVVFGDLDGDVVFRGIDWMLYDPDTPPDDEIGNLSPGTPGVPSGTPPYINPTPGWVYDPDDPPTLHPPKVCVCADGTAGTLVEKGDAYRLYVKDGHLFYESSGTTWDMGPYAGGCTCVDPDGDEPERTDDGELFPFDPIELPPAFGVELLAWVDGGLADPPAASVTVTGVHPGHDCLLIVMVNALGTATNATGLAPVIAGGGFDWAAHRRDEDQAADGASSFLALAPVGRTDPGTFSVSVTWAAGMTPRSHIVTVWKATAVADNYLERFDAGAVLYALTDSNPPDEIEPGDGFHTVELAADRQPSDVAVPTRLVDITVAQSLAEESTGPFGAILSEANGPWVYPPNAPPQPAPVLLAGEWSDDFERADGNPGPNWIIGPGPGYADEVHALFIEDGALYATAFISDGAGGYAACAMHWHEPQGVDQAIEIEVNGDQYCYLFTNANTTDKAQQFCDFGFGTPGQITISLSHSEADGDHVSGASTTVSWDNVAPVRLRLESDADGTQRVYVDDVLVLTAVDPAPVAGPYVGLGIDKNEFGDIDRILRASGSSLGAVRKTSWVAGWRVGATTDLVMLDDVNTGVDDIQSAQVCLVLESGETESGWRILDYELRADLTGVTAAGALTFDNPPRPGSLVAVFVGMTAATDVIDAVSVTGADFARTVTQHKTGSSRGQGAIFTVVAPLTLIPGSWSIAVAHPACESVSAVVYEISAPDDEGPLGAHASGVLGTNVAGSVNGADSITLNAAGDAAAVVLAFLHVAAEPSTGSGATTVDGDEWHEELQHSPANQRGYLHTMSRAPGQDPESTSTDVHWADVQTGTAATFSAVQLALEVHPYDGLPPLTGSADPVALGGVTDRWNGTIHSAAGYDRSGSPLWKFPV